MKMNRRDFIKTNAIAATAAAAGISLRTLRFCQRAGD